LIFLEAIVNELLSYILSQFFHHWCIEKLLISVS
jgi:hypothetical protein